MIKIIFEIKECAETKRLSILLVVEKRRKNDVSFLACQNVLRLNLLFSYFLVLLVSLTLIQRVSTIYSSLHYMYFQSHFVAYPFRQVRSPSFRLTSSICTCKFSFVVFGMRTHASSKVLSYFFFIFIWCVHDLIHSRIHSPICECFAVQQKKKWELIRMWSVKRLCLSQWKK